jgi:hypothetical protein
VIEALIAAGKIILAKAATEAATAKAKEELGVGETGSIGSATRANPVTGPEIKTSEVGAEESPETKGSEITPFEYQIDENMSPQQELMTLLQQKEGIVAAADGTYLESSQNEELSGDMTEGFFDKISNWYSSLDKDTQDAIEKALTSSATGIATGLFNKALGVEGKFSTGKAPAAGGTVGRPIVFNPVGRKSGGVLDRSMFTPMFHGGELDGPGGPKDDLIPVMASDGEFMLSKAAVDQAGGGNHNKGIARLTAFNNMGNRKYGN